MGEPIVVAFEDPALRITWKRCDNRYLVTASLEILSKLGYPNASTNGFRIIVVTENQHPHTEIRAVERGAVTGWRRRPMRINAEYTRSTRATKSRRPVIFWRKSFRPSVASIVIRGISYKFVTVSYTH